MPLFKKAKSSKEASHRCMLKAQNVFRHFDLQFTSKLLISSGENTASKSLARVFDLFVSRWNEKSCDLLLKNLNFLRTQEGNETMTLTNSRSDLRWAITGSSLERCCHSYFPTDRVQLKLRISGCVQMSSSSEFYSKKTFFDNFL